MIGEDAEGGKREPKKDRLWQIMERAIKANKRRGILAMAGAKEYVLDALGVEQHRYLAGFEIVRRLQQMESRSLNRSGAGSSSVASETATLPLWEYYNLESAYVLDATGGNTKETLFLNLKEFDRLIEIRRRQHEADGVHLAALVDARSELAPIWTKHPTWTFQQVHSAKYK